MNIYTIGAAIGWKHNDIPGMSTVDGVITEFPANVRGVNYEDGLPTQADQNLWTREYETYRKLNEYKRLREIDYDDNGATVKNLIVALWERIVENRPETSDSIQDSRAATKTKYPKGL